MPLSPYAVISEDHLIGPYFFDTGVNHGAYLYMLQTWFVPQLGERGLEATPFLQQDVAPAHYTLRVREYLDDTSQSIMGWMWI
jgi:hypothetical protein